MSAEKRNQLRDIAQEQLPSPIFTMAYMEHQIDLMATILLDIAKTVEYEEGSPEALRVEALGKIMEQTSIDFANLEHPLESYKLPNTYDFKKRTRRVQQMYLAAQVEAGLI